MLDLYNFLYLKRIILKKLQLLKKVHYNNTESHYAKNEN